MAKVKITGHASGTGVLTVTAPNTSSDRTITLPDATGTLLNSDGDGSSLTGVGLTTHIGSTTRNLATAGTQTISGLSFQPSFVFLYGGIYPVAGIMSFGIGNASSSMCISDNENNTTKSWNTHVGGTIALDFVPVGGSANCRADVSAFTSDGFTLTWSLGGSPTGTATIFYVAIE